MAKDRCLAKRERRNSLPVLLSRYRNTPRELFSPFHGGCFKALSRRQTSINSSSRLRIFKPTTRVTERKRRASPRPFLSISGTLPLRENVSAAAAYPANKSRRKDSRSIDRIVNVTFIVIEFVSKCDVGALNP